MDLNEVPQEPLEYKDRDKLRKLMYATDKKGVYTGIASSGWEAENIATRQAWEAIEEEITNAEKMVRSREVSPIAYFMAKKLMDVPLLARYVGKWQWQVKRHMKPKVFEKLSDKMIARYADVFAITPAELKNFGK